MISIKSPAEITKMKKSGSILAGALKEVAPLVIPGKTTKYLDEFIENYIVKHGALPSFKGYKGFPNASCISINEEVVHGIPSSTRVLLPGDVVGIDAGVYQDGFHADMAYTFTVGEIAPRTKILLETTKKSLAEGIKVIKPGIHLGDISYAIESVAKERGFGVVRDLYGHGIGEHLHEDPLVPNFGPAGVGPIIKEGMTFALEPMFNLGSYEINTLQDGWTVITKDGSISAHFEHTIVVTSTGAEILTLYDERSL